MPSYQPETVRDETVFDEKNNTVLVLRYENWSDNPEKEKLYLRKCRVDKNTGDLNCDKGFPFLTPAGADSLVEEMVRRGFGDTNELLKILSNRKDKDEAIEVEYDEEEYYDPSEIFATEVK